MLSRAADSIKNATVSINTDGGYFEPTGSLKADFALLVTYYQKQLSNFTIKATLKRILLAIANELEIMKKQIEETIKKLKQITQSVASLKLKELKKYFTSPSKEGKAGNSTMTEQQVAQQTLGDKDASNINAATANAP